MNTTKSKWEERVRAWRESGQTAAHFATGKPFKPSTLTWWASQLPKLVPPKPGPPKLVMARVIRVPTPSSASMTVSVGRARIDVSRGFDAELLREVVACLEGHS